MSAPYLSSKMKRKDLNDVSDDFSDFSLSSPARKIRRLDAELPPIMEEEEAEIHPSPATFGVEQKQPQQLVDYGAGNQERAMVVFKPVQTNLLLHSPSNISIDSDLISGFKSQFLKSSCKSDVRLPEEEERETANECMAVVPWVPSQFPFASQAMDDSNGEAPELMEAEQDGQETMDIEYEGNNSVQSNGNEFGGTNMGLPQWQQQHCLIPQLPHNTSTPISWYR